VVQQRLAASYTPLGLENKKENAYFSKFQTILLLNAARSQINAANQEQQQQTAQPLQEKQQPQKPKKDFFRKFIMFGGGRERMAMLIRMKWTKRQL